MERKHYVVLLILLLFHYVNNFIIIMNDTTPLLWDGGDYFQKSLRYFDVLLNPGPDFLSAFNNVSRYRPPLFLLSSLPLYYVFGRSTDVAVMTNLIYLLIMVLSVYGIGRRLHSRETGLLAAFTTSVFPIIFGLSRSYWLDFPVTAMVTLSVYLLIRTDNFSNWKYSVLFGVSAGLGMLTKWTYFVFLAGPFFYFFLSSLTGERKNTGSPVLKTVVSLLVALLVSSFWYIPNGLNVATKLLGLSVGMTGEEATRFQQLGETIGPSGIFNPRSLLFFAGKFVNEQVSFVFAVLFSASVIFLLKKRNKKDLWALLLWVAVPLIAFTLIKNKTTRNTVPMLPAVGILISMGAMSITARNARKAAIALILFAGLFQYAVTSYGCSFLPKRVALNTSIGDFIFFEQPENHSYAVFRSKKGDWKADTILDTIDADKGDKKNVEIVLLPRDAFTWMAMEYSSYLKGMPFTFIGAIERPESVLESDYVLIKNGGFVAPWFGMRNIYHSLDLMEENMKDYTLIEAVELPEKRNFLPVYDAEATKLHRKSGIIFSDTLQVVDYAVSEKDGRAGKTYTVETLLKSMTDIEEEIIVVFNFMNKKMQSVLRRPADPVTRVTGLKAGQQATIKASLVVPNETAERIFSLEIGFYDRTTDRALTYNPSYLIYKRTAS